MAESSNAPAYTVDKCSSCQAPIIWSTTRNGKRMPVDAEPVPLEGGGGNITLGDLRDGSPLATVHGNPASLFGATRVYRSHFVTCPFRERHRRPRSRAS